MTLGFESNFPTPLASAAVMKKSMAKLGDRCENPNPLNPPESGDALKEVASGRPLVPVPVDGTTISGGGGMVFVGPGLEPTCGAPPKMFRPFVVVPAKPSSVPISRAKDRVAETTR